MQTGSFLEALISVKFGQLAVSMCDGLKSQFQQEVNTVGDNFCNRNRQVFLGNTVAHPLSCIEEVTALLDYALIEVAQTIFPRMVLSLIRGQINL